jgi:hypothetical protein
MVCYGLKPRVVHDFSYDLNQWSEQSLDCLGIDIMEKD